MSDNPNKLMKDFYDEIGYQDFVIKVSAPTQNNERTSRTYLYNKEKEEEECTICTDQQKSERVTLISLYAKIESLSEEYYRLVKADDRKADKVFDELNSENDRFISLQANTKPTSCFCWVNKPYDLRTADEYYEDNGLIKHIYNGKVCVSISQDTSYYLDKFGKKVYQHDNTTYYLSPRLQILRPCNWHGSLCNSVKMTMCDKIMSEGLNVVKDYADPIVTEIVNGDFIKRHEEGPPPLYGIYKFFSDEYNADILCYDTCRQRNLQIRREEILISTDDSVKINAYIKDFPNKATQITNDINIFDTYIKRKKEASNKLKGLKVELNNLEKDNSLENALDQVNIQINEAEEKYTERIKFLGEVWNNRFSIKNSIPDFNTVLEMKDPGDDEKLWDLWDLVNEYKDAQNSDDKKLIKDDIMDEINTVYGSTEMSDIDLKETDKEKFLEKNSSNEIKHRDELFKKKKRINRQISDKQTDLVNIKQKISNNKLTVLQTEKGMEDSAKITYFKCRKFLDQTEEYLAIGKSPEFVYFDEDEVIPKNETENQKRNHAGEINTKLFNSMKSMTERCRGISRKLANITDILFEKGVTTNELNVEYDKWTEDQRKMNMSRTERAANMKTNVKAEAVIKLSDNPLEAMFGNTDTSNVPIYKTITLETQNPIKNETNEEPTFRKRSTYQKPDVNTQKKISLIKAPQSAENTSPSKVTTIIKSRK